MVEEHKPRTLSTAQRACAVVEALKRLDGAGVSELAEELGMSKGGVYNYLATLHEAEFVVKTDGQYRLSARLFNLGEYVKHENLLYTVAREEVDELSTKTGESTHLMIEQFGKGYYLHKAQAEKGISKTYHQKLLQEPDYLHWSSSGKAVLAAMPDQRAREILERHGMPRMTENTVTDPDELLAELATIRERGYSLNDEEQIRGARAVGAAITDQTGAILGAISVSGPTSRIDDEKFTETYPDLVSRTKNVIEVELETQDGQDAPTL